MNIARFLYFGFFISTATGGLCVWLYNRTLAHLHESLFKKVAALVMLPLGCFVGLTGGLRTATGVVGAERNAWLLVSAIGLAIFIWYGSVAFRHARWMRGSSLEWAPRGPEAINWRQLAPWARVLLRVLAPVNQVGRLRIHRREVPIAGLPVEFQGYRIVHLTDFHIHKTLTPAWYWHVVDTALRLEPDVILFGGDFVSKGPHIRRIPRIMRRLRAPDGVFFVRGNHDFWRGPRRIARLAQSAGMQFLSNRGVVLRRGHARIALIGIESPYMPLQPARLRRLPRPRVALVHTPDACKEALSLGCALAFAGHTHGGQVRLPWFGTTLSGTAAGPLKASQISRSGGMLTITSNGQGAFFPLRINTPPEIVMVELRRA